MTRTRIALVAVAVALAAASLGGTAGNSASGRTAARSAAHPAGLVPFRSCGALLGYVKAQARAARRPVGLRRLVARARHGGARRRGSGGRLREDGCRHRPRRRASTTPGTNVQEQGVDEPDSVKTNGKTLFAVAGEPAERGRRHRLAPEAARLAEARRRLEPRAPARRQPPARALARRLLADAAARPARRSRCRSIPPTRSSRRSTSRTRRRCGSSER